MTVKATLTWKSRMLNRGMDLQHTSFIYLIISVFRLRLVTGA